GQSAGRGSLGGEGCDDGQGLLALPQVAPGTLAGGHRIAPDTKQVVHGLEGQAEVVAVLLQHVRGLLGRPAEYCPDGNGAGQQRTGLVALHLQALLDRDPFTVLEGDVLGLTVDELAGGRGESSRGPSALD